MRIFCLSHAGGGATAFHVWHDQFGPDIEVCPIALPGREARLAEPAISDFDQLSEAIFKGTQDWLDLPFAIFGHSMGALLAFEWARRLQIHHNLRPVWLFLSGRRAPDLAAREDLLYSLPDGEFLDALRLHYQGIPEEFLQSPELVEFYLPILRADIAVVESYVFRDLEPLECPVSVFAGANDGTVTYDELLGWNRQTSGEFAAHILPGAHFYPQEPLIKAIKAALSRVGP